MNLREFGDWGLRVGHIGNPDGYNSYDGQCVSLIQQYLNKVFGMPFKARGNAKDWAYNIPEGFYKLSANVELQPGDIVVYGSNYGGGYGHIGLIDINRKFYDQNGVKSLAIGYRDNPFINYICVLRPRDKTNIIEEVKQPEFLHKVDELVVYSSCYRDNNDSIDKHIDCKSTYGAWQQRYIKKIVGGLNPYMLDNGMFINDGDIRFVK